jgi:DNA-directed RNA polymerase specialized sigma24 family protein
MSERADKHSDERLRDGPIQASERDWLAHRFQQNRPHLRAVAYRMLGSSAEADDAAQDAWLRVSRADTSDVQNLTGWLTTVVARVCLNMMQSRNARRERPLDEQERRARCRSARSGGAGRFGRDRAARGTRHPHAGRAVGVRAA